MKNFFFFFKKKEKKKEIIVVSSKPTYEPSTSRQKTRTQINPYKMLSPLKNVYYPQFKNNMEFFPEESHIHIESTMLSATQHQPCDMPPGQPPHTLVSANTAPPSSNGTMSPPHCSEDDMDLNAEGNYTHINEATLPSPQDRSPHLDDNATQTAADLPKGVGNWQWKEDKEKKVLGPYDYIASEPGKELRTVLLSKFNFWLQVPEKSLKVIANIVRMLHTASLLIDDIQDNSLLRRGKPVAHRIYGVAQTINAGNYVYFQALQELYKLSNPAAAIEIFTTELMHLHRGQGMDLWWRDTLTCPTVEEYLEMVSNKTGGLFRLAIGLMQIESPRSIDCIPLVDLMGLIFQIVDDYKNLSDVDYTAKKGVCEDLTEGKFSFPVIHSIQADPKNTQLVHILAQRSKDIEVKKTAVRYIESTGSLAYTREYVERLTVLAKEVADELGNGIGGSEGIHTLLNLISIR